MLTGPVMDPRVAHELYMRMDHLGVRMKAHSQTSLFLAKNMAKENLPVIYPGLETHAQHGLLKTMIDESMGFGGILTLECADAEQARVIYQPVTIETREITPRIIREDNYGGTH